MTQELLTVVRERKGGITEEDLETATSFLMADLGGALKFTWFQFEKWCVHDTPQWPRAGVPTATAPPHSAAHPEPLIPVSSPAVQHIIIVITTPPHPTIIMTQPDHNHDHDHDHDQRHCQVPLEL